MSAINDRYNFFMTHNGLTRQVKPVQDDVSLQLVREQDQIFFKLRIKSDVLLRTGDFHWLYEIEKSDDRCLPIEFKIEKKTPTGYFKRYSAIAFCDDFEFDTDGCEALLKIDAQDPYTKLLNMWEKEINLLVGTTKIGVNTNFKYITSPLSTFEELQTEETIAISFGGSNDFSNPDFPDTDQAWVMLQDIVVVIDDGVGGLFAKRNVYWAREITTATYTFPAQPAGENIPGGWDIVDFAGGASAKYGRFIESFEKVEETMTQTYTFGMIPGVWTFDEYRKTFAWIPYEVDKYSNGLAIETVFDKFLAGTGMAVKSNVFGINPVGASPANQVYDILTHTGLVIYQRSDCLNPRGSDPATIFNLSFKEFLAELKNQFQVYPTVSDDGTTLIVEHVSFYDDQHGLDFNASPYKISIAGKSGYSYDRKQTPIGEAFFHEAERECQTAFKRWQFTYEIVDNDDGIPPNCLTRPEGIKTTIAEKTVNDLQTMISRPSSFSDVGLTIIGTFDYEGQRMMDADEFTKTANWRMSPTYLQKYWYHRRFFPFGEYRKPGSVQYFPFLSVVRTKKQKELEIKMPDFATVDLTKQQKTQLGWGDVESAEYSLKTGILNLTLLHE